MSAFRGWIVVLGASLVPAALWLASPADLKFAGTAPALRSLANLAAIIGTATFAVTMIVSARIGVVERVLGGFDQMYRIHRRLGYAVPVLLVVHAGLVASATATKSLQAVLNLFLPVGGWNVFLGVLALVGLVAVVLIQVLRGLRHETFVRVHRLVGIAFVLGSLHMVLLPSTMALPPLLIVYLFGLVLAGIAAFAYRSVLGRYLVRRYRYQIEQVNPLGPAAVELVLSPIGGAMAWKSGQFAFVTILDGGMPREAHPFSITSAPDDPRLRFVVKALGDFTTRLVELRPGGVALVEGPYGDFRFTDAGSLRQVWIAGGIGVTPFLGWARTLDDPRYAIDLYYCTERADDAFVQDALFELADANPRLRVIPIRKVSLGHIDIADLQGVSGDLARQDIFLCGPLAMVNSLRRQLHERGVPSGQIHFEDFAVLSV